MGKGYILPELKLLILWTQLTGNGQGVTIIMRAETEVLGGDDHL
jgi:hypothetical protein